MGPALMDDEWIYGSRPDQIFATIAEGRPNGMPTWKYRLEQSADLAARRVRAFAERADAEGRAAGRVTIT